MRKFAVIGTALALLAGTTAAVSVASASAAPKHAAADSATVLHLISHQKSLQVIGIGQKGLSPADEVIETTLDFQHGTPVDRSVINCVLIKLTGRVMHVPCHGAMIFKDGLVQISGETDFHTPFTVAVTGGTGAYQNAGGQLTAVRTTPHTTTDVLTLRLVFLKTGQDAGRSSAETG